MEIPVWSTKRPIFDEEDIEEEDNAHTEFHISEINHYKFL
jgi:hypothetical protein